MQPSIFLFGWQVDEPVTAATDLLVATVCLIFWWKLSRVSPKPAFLGWMRAYFLLFAIGTFFGGLFGHAFLRLGSFNWMKMPGWLPGMVATALLARASIEFLKPVAAQNFTQKLRWLPWLLLAATAAAMFWRPDFVWVKTNGFLQVIGIVLPISLFVFRETKHPGSRLFLWAIGWTTLASLFFSQKISPHIWFNHADASHVFLAVAAWFYFRGAVAFARAAPSA